MRKLLLFNILCLAFLAVSCDKKEPDSSDNPTPVDPVPQVVKVTGVKLDKTSAELKVGETLQLSATVEPANATEKSVSWKTDNSSIADVDGKGLVTALKGGTTTISVITKDGNLTASATITVKEPLAIKVYYDGKEVGDTLTYKLGSSPGDSLSFELFDKKTEAFVDADNLEISSSSKEVATYLGKKGGSGFVKAVSDGLSTLTFTYGKETIGSITLNVLLKPTEFGVYTHTSVEGIDPMSKDLEIAEGSLVRINPSTGYTFLDLFDLTNKTRVLYDDSVMYETSDEKVANIVSNYGFSYTWGLWGKGPGRATITLGYGEFRRTFDVKVTDYIVYFEGKDPGTSILSYRLGTKPGDLVKISVFDKATDSFLKTSDWKVTLYSSNTRAEVNSYTETECLIKIKTAGMIPLSVADTSDGTNFVFKTLSINVKAD